MLGNLVDIRTLDGPLRLVKPGIVADDDTVVQPVLHVSVSNPVIDDRHADRDSEHGTEREREERERRPHLAAGEESARDNPEEHVRDDQP